MIETPAFGEPKRNLNKIKIKTEATEEEFENYNKILNLNI